MVKQHTQYCLQLHVIGCTCVHVYMFVYIVPVLKYRCTLYTVVFKFAIEFITNIKPSSLYLDLICKVIVNSNCTVPGCYMYLKRKTVNKYM